MLSFGMNRLEALSMLETGHNDRMVGRHGEISRYQILKREWRRVTKSTRYTDPKTAKIVTLKILDRRIRAFQNAHGRSPTNFEFYALWNAPAQAMSGRISPVVAERCRRYANLCTVGGNPPPIPLAGSPSSALLASASLAMR